MYGTNVICSWYIPSSRASLMLIASLCCQLIITLEIWTYNIAYEYFVKHHGKFEGTLHLSIAVKIANMYQKVIICQNYVLFTV